MALQWDRGALCLLSSRSLWLTLSKPVHLLLLAVRWKWWYSVVSGCVFGTASPCAWDWRYPNKCCWLQQLHPTFVPGTLVSLSTSKVDKTPVFQVSTCWSPLFRFVYLRWKVFEASLCCIPHFTSGTWFCSGAFNGGTTQRRNMSIINWLCSI